ncbi:hypothetical protein EU538_13065 [Candidatus Thorarchaeota archaeon]|nr:MAG: hypothetical protein EU538_13065 [Candidatus Thorarchaeota archaeon]
MFQCCGLKFSQIKGKDVVDANGKKIGRAVDFVVTFTDDNWIELKSVILGGSRVEELLESIGARPDIDPVFQLDCISQIDEEMVRLAVAGDTLKDTLDSDVIGANDMKMSDLSKIKVTDSDGFKIGNAIDVWFDASGDLWLVLGGGFLEETLESLNAQPDIDLLVPSYAVKSMSRKDICLKWTKFQLESNAQDEYEKYKREITSKWEPQDARYTQLRLFPGPSGGPI